MNFFISMCAVFIAVLWGCFFITSQLEARKLAKEKAFLELYNKFFRAPNEPSEFEKREKEMEEIRGTDPIIFSKEDIFDPEFGRVIKSKKKCIDRDDNLERDTCPPTN